MRKGIANDVTAAIVVLVIGGLSELRADERAELAFRQEAPAGWRAYDESIRNLIGTAKYSDRSLPSEPWRTRSMRFGRFGGSYFDQATELDREGQSVSVNNASDGYHFSAVNDGTAGWRLRNVERTALAEPSVQVREIGFLRFLESPITVAGLFLRDLVTDPAFEVRDAHFDDDAAGVKLTVVFDYRGPLAGIVDSEIVIKRGTLVLDPKNSWSIVRYACPADVNVRGKQLPMLIGCEVEYDNVAAVPRLPRKVWYRRSNDDFTEGTETIVEFEGVQRGKARPDDFTFAAFGLETGVIEQTQVSSPWLYRIFLVVANTIVLAVVIAGWVVIRRRSSKDVPPGRS